MGAALLLALWKFGDVGVGERGDGLAVKDEGGKGEFAC